MSENIKKTAFISGGSRGIGQAIAFKLAAIGYNIAVNYYKSEGGAQHTVSEIRKTGVQASAFQGDISDFNTVSNIVKNVIEQFGTIDLLVCNAGISQQCLFTDITEADWDRMFNVNVKGMYNCCHEVLPHMIRRHSGKIITISSIWGIVGASCEVHYSASKAAIIGMTKALAKEVGPSNIQVNCVAPGVINTEMNSMFDNATIDALKEETPLGKIGTAQDIANCVAFLASENADFITGQVLSPNGGFVI